MPDTLASRTREAALNSTESDPVFSPSDWALLRAISDRRDRDAFAELLGRYEEPVASLCLHITGNRDDAQDLTQEILLAVWTRAETFREDVNPRAWILRMATHRCLKFFRRERAARRKKEVEAEQMRRSSARRSEGAPQAAEKGELLAALRDSLRTLNETDRLLLALRYGAELSQQEVARELAFSQQGVSKKIQNALHRLRGHLQTAGFAAALPLVSPRGLNEALCSGLTVSEGVREHLLAAVARADAPGGAARLRDLGAVAAAKAGAVLAGMMALAAASVAWRATAPRPADTATVREASGATSPDVSPETRAAKASFRYRWTFEKQPDPGQLRLAHGEFEWCRLEKGGPWGLLPDFEKHAHILVLPRIPPGPFLVSMKALPHPRRKREHVNLGANYIDGDVIQGFRFGVLKNERPLRTPFVISIVFLDRHCFLWFDGHGTRWLREYDRPYPGDRVYLSLMLAFLTEAEIRSLSSEEIVKYGAELEDLRARVSMSEVSPSNQVALPRDLLAAPK